MINLKLESDKNMTMGDIDWNISDQYDISISNEKTNEELL